MLLLSLSPYLGIYGVKCVSRLMMVVVVVVEAAEEEEEDRHIEGVC
jgi:hypothetical protein